MATKTWAFSDLEGVARKGGVACLPVALLNRIVREAMAAFDAPNGAVVLEVDSHKQADGVTSLAATLHFDAIKLAWGHPEVAIRVEQRDDRFSMRIGGRADTAVLGYDYDFGWTEETPAALFPALFSCVLESMRTNKALK
jgi:hypothetical protein